MSMAGNAIAPETAQGPGAEFLALSRRSAPAYRRIMRGLVDVLEPAGPERFVRSFLEQCFRDEAPLAGQETAVVQVLRQAPHADGLALVSGALLAIEAGLWDDAALLAERAYALDQHETFAQRLHLAAEEQSATLRLAVDGWLADRFCGNPFTDAEIIGNLDLYTCCAAWMPAPVGPLAGGALPEHIWNGPRIAELRRSVLDGDFSYCSRLSCPKIAARNLPRREDVADPVLRQAIDQRSATGIPLPRRLLLSYDTSCNLSCPSCRTGLIQKTQAEAARLDVFFDETVEPLLAQAREIKITGSGDPFGSRHFRRVLGRLASVPADKVGGARLQLHTNGVLFDPRAWEELKLEGHVRSVWVSVDATEPETYAELRRDGDYDRLWRNLGFLGKLRREGRIGALRLDFVVQAANFRQMPDLIDRAVEIGADGVHFLMLRNWGTFDDRTFLDKAVAMPGHPLHAELLQVLEDPSFDRPGVDLGNLAPLRGQALAARDRRPAAPAQALPPVLLVLAPPRSGSNLLFDMLDGCRQALVLREAFNPIGLYGADAAMLAEFSALLGTPLLGPTDDRLVRHLRRNPVDSLLQMRRMTAARGRKALILKVFPDHIPDGILTGHLLPDPMVRPLLLLRAPLEAWISLQKARAGWNWTATDTTDLRPTVDPADFALWQDRLEGWLDTIRSGLAAFGRNPTLLRHDELSLAPDLAVQRVTDLLEALLPELRGDLPAPSARQRQDRTADPFDRIANGAELRAWLAAQGRLDRALRAGLPGNHTD